MPFNQHLELTGGLPIDNPVGGFIIEDRSPIKKIIF
jgi:hypothetical protein